MNKNQYVASTKVLPLVYLGEDDLLEYEDAFGKLMKGTKTKIEFNYSDQYFHIQGRSQSNCDDVAQKIKKFLSVFENLLAEDPFKNTYCNMERFPSQHLLDDLSALSSPTSSNSPQVVHVSGRFISVLEDDDDDDDDINGVSKTTNNSNNNNNNNSSSNNNSQTTPPADSQSTQQQGFPSYYRGDTESEGESESDDDEFTGSFTFAKNIGNPNDVLTGLPLIERKYSNNLKEIEHVTGTECCLVPNTKTINIVGSTQKDVDDAIARFKQLQTVHKRRGKEPTCVPCIHPNPNDPNPFMLYFADLDHYRYKHTVFVSPDYRQPLYTLLPVYSDPQTGTPIKPTDLVGNEPPTRSPVSRPSPPSVNHVSPPTMTPSNAYRSPTTKPSRSYSRPPSSAGPSSPRTATPTSPRPVSQHNDGLPAGSWGNQTVMQAKPNLITPEAEQWKNRQQILPTSAPSVNPVDDFPSLPSKPAQKPTLHAPGKGMQRRVMRINNQKASSPTEVTPTKTIHDVCRDYNFNNAKLALTEGLECLRGIPGEIKFGAKFGKILWRNVPPNVQRKTWQFQEIKDYVMKECKAIPVFNNVMTVNENLIATIYDKFPDCSSISKVFEIHAMARNQPSLEFQPVILSIIPGTVDYQKVVLRKHRITEVDWVSLDRKFDFQMYLGAEELGRKDVKPFTTFLKTVMIDTTNYNLTFDNVENFLTVTHVYFKRTTKHRLHFPFVLEITRVERVPLAPQTFGRTLAEPGTGDVWYDCEVFCTSNNEFFKRNMSLKVGKVATWTLPDIFGENDQMLMEYLKCMLIVNENFELTMGMPSSSPSV